MELNTSDKFWEYWDETEKLKSTLQYLSKPQLNTPTPELREKSYVIKDRLANQAVYKGIHY